MQILRLEALKLYGGIYLDLDVFVIKPFAPFYNRTMVMAQEAEHDNLDRLEPSGLCNGVIMAQPYARFIVRIYFLRYSQLLTMRIIGRHAGLTATRLSMTSCGRSIQSLCLGD